MARQAGDRVPKAGTPEARVPVKSHSRAAPKRKPKPRQGGQERLTQAPVQTPHERRIDKRVAKSLAPRGHAPTVFDEPIGARSPADKMLTKQERQTAKAILGVQGRSPTRGMSNRQAGEVLLSPEGAQIQREAQQVATPEPQPHHSFFHKVLGALEHHGEKMARNQTEPTDTVQSLGDFAGHPLRSLEQHGQTQAQESGFLPGQMIAGAGKVAATTVEHPGVVGRATVKSFPGITAGLIAAPVYAAMDPGRALKALKQDYATRYGPEAGKAVEREGLLPYLLDLGVAGTAFGRTATPAAAEGAFGETLRRVATEGRKPLQVGTVERTQRTSPNLILAAGQKALDAARERRVTKHERQAVEGARPLRPDEAAIRRTDSGDRAAVAPLSPALARRGERMRFATARGAATVQHRIAQRESVTALENEAHATLTKEQLNGGALRYAIEHGIRTPEQAARFLPELERIVEEGRRQAAVEGRPVDIPWVQRNVNDELATIRDLEQHPELFDEKLAAVAEKAVALGDQLAHGDPSLRSLDAEERRVTPQALVLGQEPRKGGVLRDQQPALEQSRAAAAERESAAAAGVQQAKLRLDRARASEAEELRVAKRDASRRRASQQRGGVSTKLPDLPRAAGERLMNRQADTMIAERQLEHARQAFEDARAERSRLRAHIEDLPEFASEPIRSFVARTEEAQHEAGLARPGYFPHEKDFRPRLSLRTHGSGLFGAMRSDRQTHFTLMQEGRADVRAAPFFQALARNLKRKYSWNFAISTARDFALKDVRRVDTGERIDVRNKTPAQLAEAIRHGAIDPKDVVLWNPRIMLREGPKDAGRDLEVQDLRGADEAFAKSTHEIRSVADLERLDANDFKTTRGWHLISRTVYDEMAASFKYQGLLGRLARKYVKGIPSRIILGMNPSWAVIQVLNNVALAELAGVHPTEWATAAKYWRDNPDLRRRIEPYAGSSPFVVEHHLGRIGSAAPDWGLVRYYQALRDTPLMRKAAQHNPMDLLFKADATQNRFFREAVAYNQLKRLAAERMGEGVNGIAAGLQKVGGLFDGRPDDVMRNLMQEQGTLEEIGAHVDDTLGNYTRYTATERRTLEQNLMFYGFLRFSVRFTLYTLPFKHPIVASLLVNLSRLNQQETRRLLGAGPNDPLPFGALANYYRVRNGKLEAFGLGRLNPAMNALTQAHGPAQLLGVLPPIYTQILDQMTGRDLFMGKDFKIEGQSAPIDAAKQRVLGWGAIPTQDRVRIFVEQFLQQSAPYRTAEQLKFRGEPQGVDSMLLSPRPTQYKSPAVLKSIRKSEKRQRGQSPWSIIAGGQLPFVPHPSQDAELEKSLQANAQRALEQLGRRKKKSSSSSGAGLGGSLGGGGLGGGMGGSGF